MDYDLLKDCKYVVENYEHPTEPIGCQIEYEYNNVIQMKNVKETVNKEFELVSIEYYDIDRELLTTKYMKKEEV